MSSCQSGEVIFPTTSLCIARIKCIAVYYIVNKPYGNTAYLCIRNTNDPKTLFSIFKRSINAEGKEYFSLVFNTMYNGTNWKPYLFWRFFYKINDFQYERYKVSYNSTLCHHICYRSNDLNTFQFKKQNSQDIKLMWDKFIIESSKHNSIKFIEASIQAFYVREYIPLQAGIQNLDEIQYYMNKLNHDKYDILENKNHKISEINQIKWIDQQSEPHIYNHIEVKT